jgi:hypothetical protein
MNKPKYKLGDIIQDCTGTVEIIIAIEEPYQNDEAYYRYKTQYDDPRNRNYHKDRFAAWYQTTIDKYYTVIGNLFDKEKQHESTKAI